MDKTTEGEGSLRTGYCGTAAKGKSLQKRLQWWEQVEKPGDGYLGNLGGTGPFSGWLIHCT